MSIKSTLFPNWSVFDEGGPSSLDVVIVSGGEITFVGGQVWCSTFSSICEDTKKLEIVYLVDIRSIYKLILAIKVNGTMNKRL